MSYADGFSNVPRPVFGHGLVYIATGFQQPSLLAVRPDGTGDVTKTHVAWTLKRGAPLTPSPLARRRRALHRQRRRHRVVPRCEDRSDALGAAARRRVLGVAGVRRRTDLLSERRRHVDRDRAGQRVQASWPRARSTARSSRRWRCRSGRSSSAPTATSIGSLNVSRCSPGLTPARRWPTLCRMASAETARRIFSCLSKAGRRRAPARAVPACPPISSASRPGGSASSRCSTPSSSSWRGSFRRCCSKRIADPVRERRCGLRARSRSASRSSSPAWSAAAAVRVGRDDVGSVFEVASAATASPPPNTSIRWTAGLQRGSRAVLGRGVDACCSRSSCRRRRDGRSWRAGVGQLGPGDHRDRLVTIAPDVQAGPGSVLLLVHLSVSARRAHGVRRRARGLRARHRSDARARAGQLQAGGAARAGRHGRSVARRASAAGAAGGDQADSAVAHRPMPADGVVGGRRAAVRARSAGDREPAIAAHRQAVRLRRRRRRRVLLRDGAARRPRRRDARAAFRARAGRARRFTSCARCATRCPKRTRAASCIATSSRRTSFCAATARTTTS